VAAQAEADLRFTVPLYTVAEAARYVRVPSSTLGDWAKGYHKPYTDRTGRRREARGEAVVTAFPPVRRGYPTIPFVGLAESMVLAAFRRAGVSLQHIRQTIPVLEAQIGVDHALASRRLSTDGAVILYDFTTGSPVDDDTRQELAGLTRVVDGQRVFAEVVRDYLRRITYGDDGWALELALPYGERDLLRVRADRAGGQPTFVRGGAPLAAIVSRWQAGDRIADLAADFEVPPHDLEDVLRAAVRIPV